MSKSSDDGEESETNRLERERASLIRAAAYWEAEAKRYQEVHDRSPEGMMIFRAVRDDQGTIVDFEWLYANPSGCKLLGLRAGDLVGKRMLTEVPGNRTNGRFANYVRVVEQGEPHSHEFNRTDNGVNTWLRVTSLKWGDGLYIGFSDLTQRKLAEENSARLAVLVRSSDLAIYSTSNAGIIETWNNGSERLFEYASEEIVGQSIYLTIPEDRRAEHDLVIQQIIDRGGVESLQTVRTTKSGATIQVSITFSPIRDGNGKTTGIAIIARDTSEQLMAHARLAAANRMVSVGTLAAGMAHEINNPLAYLIANIDVLIEEIGAIGEGSPSARLNDIAEMAFEARGGAERIRKIVRGLMTFSRADEEHRSVIDVKDVMELSVKLAFREISHKARIVKSYGTTPLVWADDARLGQVFINLLVNAAQSIGEDDSYENEIRITTFSDDAGHAAVEVTDTGPGVPVDVIGRLFDPFFTTKPAGIGAGLGLSICQNIVTGIGGVITARNAEGRGTTFRVVLPPSPLPKPSPAEPSPSIPSPRSGAVLVVDDEPSVGLILGRALRGHDVTVVTSASAALDLIASGRVFDVILSDLMMPTMSGIQFYDEVMRLAPNVAPRIVFLSGGLVTPGARDFLDRVPNERMEKPFDTASVRELVHRFIK